MGKNNNKLKQWKSFYTLQQNRISNKY